MFIFLAVHIRRIFVRVSTLGSKDVKVSKLKVDQIKNLCRKDTRAYSILLENGNLRIKIKSKNLVHRKKLTLRLSGFDMGL